MNCLRSFNFISSGSQNLSGADIDTWSNGLHNFFIAQRPAGISTFNIQGFKNINIYAIEVQGIVASGINTNNSVIINDWSFFISVQGQNSLVSGLTVGSPNPYNIAIQPTDVEFSLAKYSPKFTFLDPVKSAKSIKILGLKADGLGAENLLAVNLTWSVNFIAYYNYEGE